MPDPAKPVTGAELMNLNRWQMAQLVLHLARDMPPEELRGLMKVMVHRYEKKKPGTRPGPESRGGR